MKTAAFYTLAMIATFAVPAIAAEFPGAEATPCDADKFTPVYSANGEDILYWNNPTCVYNGQGGQPKAEEVVAPVEPVDPEAPAEEVIADKA